MCAVDQHPSMVLLNESHRQRMHDILSDEEVGIADDIFEGLTDYLNPHLIVFPALVAMTSAWLRKDFGIFEDYEIVWLPLSIVDHSGTRYRTLTMEQLHDAVLSARMSDLMIQSLRQKCSLHGLHIHFLCSCGVMLGSIESIRAYNGSRDHVLRDKTRSALDALGYPIKTISNLNEIPSPTIDIHPNNAEMRLFEDINHKTLKLTDIIVVPPYSMIERNIEYLLEAVHSSPSAKSA